MLPTDENASVMPPKHEQTPDLDSALLLGKQSIGDLIIRSRKAERKVFCKNITKSSAKSNIQKLSRKEETKSRQDEMISWRR
jgi:hypothetical protein